MWWRRYKTFGNSVAECLDEDVGNQDGGFAKYSQSSSKASFDCFWVPNIGLSYSWIFIYLGTQLLKETYWNRSWPGSTAHEIPRVQVCFHSQVAVLGVTIKGEIDTCKATGVAGPVRPALIFWYILVDFAIFCLMILDVSVHGPWSAQRDTWHRNDLILLVLRRSRWKGLRPEALVC